MIGIVGGGISGLAVAWHLQARGVPSVVLEAEPVAGGVVRTRRSGGLPLDLGPQRTRMTGDVAELVRAAGLEDEVLEAPADAPLYVYRAGKLRRVPFSLGGALATDLLDWGGKLRILAEPLTAPPRPDETVERLFVRKFGREAYRGLLGPLYGGLYASDPGRMYVRHGLRRTLEELGVEGSILLALLRRGAKARRAVPTVSFTGGMQTLPAALAERLGRRFRPGARVTAVRRPGGPQGARNASGGDAGRTRPRWRLEVVGGEPVDVDRVVLALPAPRVAEILGQAAPDAAARVGMLRYNRLAVVHLRAAESAGGVPLDGFGYQVAFGEPLETRGCTWNGALFGRDRLCVAYLGGMKSPDLPEWDDDRIADTALAEFRTVTGHEGRALGVSRTWIPAWDGSWDALDGLELPEGIEPCSSWNARPGIPGRAAMARRLAERIAGEGA